jgi:hypothetical protein
MFRILEYVYTHNEISWSWDPSPKTKFILSRTPSTHSLKETLYSIFNNFVHKQSFRTTNHHKAKVSLSRLPRWAECGCLTSPPSLNLNSHASSNNHFPTRIHTQYLTVKYMVHHKYSEEMMCSAWLSIMSVSKKFLTLEHLGFHIFIFGLLYEPKFIVYFSLNKMQAPK